MEFIYKVFRCPKRSNNIMNVYEQVMTLLQNQQFREFIISLCAGMAWDAIKTFFSKVRSKNNIECLIYKLFAATFKDFYEIKNYAYDEDLVMSEFIKEINIYQAMNSISLSKVVISNTTGQELDEADFALWEDCFTSHITEDKYEQLYRMTIFCQLKKNNIKRDLSWLDDYMQGSIINIKCKLIENIIPLLDNVKTELQEPLWDEIKTLFYEVAYNAQKHSGANDCRILIDRDSITLSDNGKPFNPLSLIGKHYGGGSISVNRFIKEYPDIDVKYSFEKRKNKLIITFADKVFNVNELSEIIVPNLIYHPSITLLYPDSSFNQYFIDIGRTIQLQNGQQSSYSAIIELYRVLEYKIIKKRNKHIFVYFPKEVNPWIYEKFQACWENYSNMGDHHEPKNFLTLIPQLE